MAEDITTTVQAHPETPLLTHLNADNSWLISFPRPDGTGAGRKYFHLIVDLWLQGTINARLWWIISVAHSDVPAFTSVDDIRKHIQAIEKAADGPTDSGEPDAILISHYLDDHCSKPDITALDPSTPVITVKGADSVIKPWKHCKNVELMPDLDLGCIQTLWKDPAKSLLPDWLRIGRLNSGEMYPALHWATIIAYTVEGETQTVMLAPHGFYEERLQDTTWATEHSQPLLLLHGLDSKGDPTLKSNLGVENGQKIVQKTRPKYWVPTHDEALTFTGVLGWLQQRVVGAFPNEVISHPDGKIGTKCRVLGNGHIMALS